MPRAPLLLLPLLLAGQLAAASSAPETAPASVFVIADTANDTLTIADNVANTIIAENSNVTVAEPLDANNVTIADLDENLDPIVRKKRTFGDIVFRGLADVLGYQVQRKPAQEAFPPPLAPVPGIDVPLQAAPAPVPAPAVVLPPCGAPRAVGPPPCRAQLPPPPPPPKPAPPPCPKPRAVPRPKPRPPPPPPPAPAPCGKGRANPATPAPCAPAPPAPKVKADPNLETITSNFRLNFNFNRAPATPSTQAAEEAPAEEQALELEQFTPIAIQPRAAKLPLAEPRKPRVFVDAFVVRNGIARRVDTLDAQHLNSIGQQGTADVDYLAYDDDAAPSEDDEVTTKVDAVQTQNEDYYDDVSSSEYRHRSKSASDIDTAVNNFWGQKKRKKKKKKTPSHDYRSVHFGDRDLADQIRRRSDESHQSLQRERPKSNRIPLSLSEPDEDSELTTTTEDPRRRLKPRVLPPTEKNPGQIDTVTVRVPPIYKERHPKKLHRDNEHERDHYDDDNENNSEEVKYESISHRNEHKNYADDENEASYYNESSERRLPRKQSRQTRSVDEHDPFSAGDYDYYGKKLPISKEEESYRGLTIPPPTLDADLARLEENPEGGGHFLNENERLQEDRKKPSKGERLTEDERLDENDRTDSKEPSNKDKEATNNNGQSDETELTEELGPNAQVKETGYRNNYEEATSKKVDDAKSRVAVKRKRTKKVSKT